VLSGVIMMFGACFLVFAFVRIASGGRGAEIVILFTIAIAAYAVTLLIEARARQPLAPLRLFFNPGRAGALAAQLLLLAGVAGSLYFLTQFLQDVPGFSALKTALAFLPLTVLFIAGYRLSPRLVRSVDPWRLMLAGMIPVIAGLAWLSGISAQTGYLAGVFGPMAAIGAGAGVMLAPLTTAALAGVAPEDSGAASGMVTAIQHFGTATDIAVLLAVFAAPDSLKSLNATTFAPVLVPGMSHALVLATIFEAVAFLLIAAMVRRRAATAPSRGPRCESPARYRHIRSRPNGGRAMRFHPVRPAKSLAMAGAVAAALLATAC